MKGGYIVAKDDYYVIAAKILIYLYRKIKNKEKMDNDYLSPMTKDFPIDETYFYYVIEMLTRQGYIEATIRKAWGGDIVSIDKDNIRILPAGIDYLKDNSSMRKVCETLKEARAIFSLFQ